MNPSLAEKSYDYIRQKLASGDYAPGKRLVNRTLADEIGVSVIPVREAISRLSSEGLIEHIPGAGAFVRKIKRQDLDHLYVLRDALESCAAGEAAKQITEEQLEEFEYILEQARKVAAEISAQSKGYSTKRQLNRWVDEEQNFHKLLIESSRNPLLVRVIEENRAIGALFEAHRSDPRLLTAEVAKITCESKAELLEALRNRNSELARQLMSAQIQRGRKTVVEHFSRQRRK